MKSGRVLLSLFVCAGLFLPNSAGDVRAAEKFVIEHPFKKPHTYTDKKRCYNCGMDRNKWARTRYEFQNSSGTYYTCSIHCVAVLRMKMREEPRNVKVAEYLRPEKMLDAQKAFFVINSTAPGTMTKRSKIAFSSKAEAEKFAARYGGAVRHFELALAKAKSGMFDR